MSGQLTMAQMAFNSVSPEFLAGWNVWQWLCATPH